MRGSNFIKQDPDCAPRNASSQEIQTLWFTCIKARQTRKALILTEFTLAEAEPLLGPGLSSQVSCP